MRRLKDREGFVPGVSGGDRNGKWPPDAAFALAAREGRVAYRPCLPPKLLDLHVVFHEARRVSSANTVDHLGKSWRITPTLKKTVWLVIHPGIRFWVVESRSDPLNPAWPTILASYTL